MTELTHFSLQRASLSSCGQALLARLERRQRNWCTRVCSEYVVSFIVSFVLPSVIHASLPSVIHASSQKQATICNSEIQTIWSHKILSYREIGEEDRS
jgi:hypothetical protein